MNEREFRRLEIIREDFEAVEALVRDCFEGQSREIDGKILSGPTLVGYVFGRLELLNLAVAEHGAQMPLAKSPMDWDAVRKLAEVAVCLAALRESFMAEMQ